MEVRREGGLKLSSSFNSFEFDGAAGAVLAGSHDLDFIVSRLVSDSGPCIERSGLPDFNRQTTAREKESFDDELGRSLDLKLPLHMLILLHFLPFSS